MPDESRKMEALLAKSMLAVANSHLDLALNDVDSLLKINPNFKLAQLVKGDLLLARSKPLTSFGDAPDAPQSRVADFRDEARVRLQRYQEQQPISLEPRYLWKMNASQHYAIVVDTSKSTLYLYQNVNGEPRYVADYYITSGKKGAAKVSEGDQKTPIGVYFVKSSLPKRELADLYGDGAYPLSYPNEWDRRFGRNGHGIWLHGTPSNTYSRPPRASNGCVVLANDDLLDVGKIIQVGITPVIITDNMHWSDAQDKSDRAALLQSLEQWRKDWASRDTDAYLRHYAPDFASGKTRFASWAQQKKLVNAHKSWIKVNLSDISVFAYPDQPNLAVVDFEQDYDSNNLSNRMKKRQYWIKHGDRWQIIYEGAA
ncbi:MAG: L,D-transpeptidase family protein [Sideroxydans sp.]|nr:L,D-transpeptidase family protein [Sideroxydans sp.]